MSENTMSASRRAFLKSGALVAAPLAAIVPVGALAADDSRAKLARLEDERALEALHRAFLRHLNGTGECGAFIASGDAVELGEGLAAIAEDLAHEAAIELAEDGRSARVRCRCRTQREAHFTGDTTLEKMARFQGQGSHRHEASEVLATEFAKTKDGWRIVGARLA